ncbi:MAG: efflux RND transporter periplasmic adaptor subunit [Sphingomonas bacterium]
MADMSDMPPHTAGPSTGTLKRVGLLAAVAAVAIAATGIVTRSHNAHGLKEVAADAAVPTVSVVRPRPGGASDVLVLPGNVQALNSAAIYARTNGYVRKWLADIGDHVRAGQPLAILDAPEVDQQLAQASADYQTALANQKLAATTAQRWSTMLSKDAVSRQEADEKAGDLAAKTALANAALANVRRLRALQGFTRIYAPFDGVVTSRSAQLGQLVVAGNAASQALFTVSDASRVRVYVRVPQGASASVHPGITATLSLPEYPDRTFPATMTRSAQAVDSNSGAVLVELMAPNPDGALKPGAFARVSFKTNGGTSTLSLPGSTIVYGGDGPSVAVVDDKGRVTVKRVTIARDEGKTVSISQGVSPADRVVDTPPDAVRTGDHVRVKGGAANAD